MLLIREVPATELTVATRILAHLGALPRGGRLALRVGADVVYLAGREVLAEVMTPYDVAAVRLADATVLAGDPPGDAERYLATLRSDGSEWGEALDRARGLGGLVGAYPAEASG